MSSAQDGSPRKVGSIQTVTLLLCVTASVTVASLLGPSLPKMQAHFAQVSGADYLVPLTVSIPMLVMTFFCVIGGVLTDKFGRVRLLTLSSVLFGIFGTAPLYLDSLHLIVGSRALLGIFEAIIMVAGVALIGDFFQGKKRARILALQATVASLSAFVLNNVGGLLGEFGWRTPYYIYAFGFALAIFSATFLWDPPRAKATAEEGSDQGIVLQPAMLALTCLFSVLVGFIFLVVPVHFAYLFVDIGFTSTANIGFGYALNSLGVISGTLIFGWVLAGKLKVGFQMTIGLVLMGLGFVSMAVSTSYLALTLSGIVNGLGAGILLPCGVSWNMRLLPAHLRGFGTGAYHSCFFFGNFLSSVLVVWLANQLDGRTAAVTFVGSVLGAFALLIFLLSFAFEGKQKGPVSS